MKRFWFVGLGLVSLMWFVGFSSTPVHSQKLVASDDVSASVAKRARSLAEEQPALRQTLRAARVVYVGTQVMRRKTDTGEEYPGKIYLVVHYRYDDDAAIHSVVNLSNSAVLEQREIPHLPTSLAQEELELARELALKDRRVRDALGIYVDRVEIEALVIRSSSKQDPWFGRRVVQLLFRIGRDYRHRPRVVVDLTNNAVLVQTGGEFK